MSTKSFEELVNERAYYIYLERTQKGVPGDAHGDRIQAEKEVTAAMKKGAAKSVEVPKAAASKTAAAKAAAPASVASAKKSEAPKEKGKPGRKPKAAAETAASAPKKSGRPPKKAAGKKK